VATAKTCQDEERAVQKAKDKRPNWVLHPIKAAEYEKKTVNPLQDKLAECKEANSSKRGILAARAAARAAADAKVSFPMRKDWHKSVGMGKKDNEVEKKLKLRNAEDAVAYVNRFAEKNDMNLVIGNAVAVEALKDVIENVKTGADVAHGLLTVLDVAASVVSMGSYAAMSPWIHRAVTAGEKITVYIVQQDLDEAEGKYQRAKKARADRIEAKRREAERRQREEQERKRREAEAAEAERKRKAEQDKQMVSAPKDAKAVEVEWYRKPGTYVAAGSIAALALIAALTTRTPSR